MDYQPAHLITFLFSTLTSFYLFRTLSRRIDTLEKQSLTSPLLPPPLLPPPPPPPVCPCSRGDMKKLEQEQRMLNDKLEQVQTKLHEMDTELFYKSPLGQHIATLEASTPE
jgi:hypothetical protein